MGSFDIAIAGFDVPRRNEADDYDATKSLEIAYEAAHIRGYKSSVRNQSHLISGQNQMASSGASCHLIAPWRWFIRLARWHVSRRNNGILLRCHDKDAAALSLLLVSAYSSLKPCLAT